MRNFIDRQSIIISEISAFIWIVLYKNTLSCHNANLKNILRAFEILLIMCSDSNM